MKVWIRFGKKNRLKYVSHLDMQRFMHRALNRTDLPFTWSQGFNPHPVMSFGSAMAMGWTSEYEVMEIRMNSEVDMQFVVSEMSSALPPDLPVVAARVVPDNMGAPMALTCMADYEITIDGDKAAKIIEQLPVYMAQEHVMAMRKTKSGEKEADIREMTYQLEEAAGRPGVICARLALTERATLKPELLVKTLSEMAGEEPPVIHVHRTGLLSQDGVYLMELKK